MVCAYSSQDRPQGRGIAHPRKQWLEQLANILSVYHVHILDLEGDKRQLTSASTTRDPQRHTHTTGPSFSPRHPTETPILGGFRADAQSTSQGPFDCRLRIHTYIYIYSYTKYVGVLPTRVVQKGRELSKRFFLQPLDH